MNEMYKMVIMDHYKFPHYKYNNEQNYQKLLGYNPSCGDKLNLYVKLNEDETLNLRWEGSGCSICCASCSIMCEEINDISKEEATIKINEFLKMLKNEKYNDTLFEDANVLIGLTEFPSRFKCGFLAWNTLDNFLKGNYEQNN